MRAHSLISLELSGLLITFFPLPLNASTSRLSPKSWLFFFFLAPVLIVCDSDLWRDEGRSQGGGRSREEMESRFVEREPVMVWTGEPVDAGVELDENPDMTGGGGGLGRRDENYRCGEGESHEQTLSTAVHVRRRATAPPHSTHTHTRTQLRL